MVVTPIITFVKYSVPIKHLWLVQSIEVFRDGSVRPYREPKSEAETHDCYNRIETIVPCVEKADKLAGVTPHIVERKHIQEGAEPNVKEAL